MRFLPAGHNGLLVECDSPEQVRQLHATLLRRRPPELVEIVPAARTVLLVGGGLEQLRKDMGRWKLDPAESLSTERIDVPVSYRGEDLESIAHMTGHTVREVIHLHCSADYQVAFCGFAPGFAYLTGLPAVLQVPRRQSPRTRVDAGSVALAGEFCGIYPRPSPGGWQVIGHTDLAIWDALRNPPALLAPGSRVRFVEVKP